MLRYRGEGVGRGYFLEIHGKIQTNLPFPGRTGEKIQVSTGSLLSPLRALDCLSFCEGQHLPQSWVQAIHDDNRTDSWQN